MAADRPSPLRNRVRPDGAIVAHPARGTMMGNRGGRLEGRRQWASKAWICCLLAFRGRSRDVTGPGYTALFFLDEATALAAGHRPCFECRRAEARAFVAAAARGLGRPEPFRAPDLDARLHAERRAAPDPVAPDALPPGAMAADADGPLLAARGGLRRWSFEGYGPPVVPRGPLVALTPPTTRAALAAGFAPRLHPSAFP